MIASPVDARVTRILKRAGDAVTTGQAILELDLSESALAFERVDREVALKRNEQQRARLDLRRSLADLDSTTEAKRLEVESLRARLAQQTELASSGLVSKDGLREAQLNEARAALELQRLIASREITEEMNKAQIDGMNLELATLEAQRREARRVLDLGSTRAPRDSVVTWTVTEAALWCGAANLSPVSPTSSPSGSRPRCRRFMAARSGPASRRLSASAPWICAARSARSSPRCGTV